jgi:hypothetical protein
VQELFTLDYGRMNATLGVELPLTNFLTQTTIPYGYIDPPTEIIQQGQTQLWKITHNGVDTHFVHFHLFNVQVVNRMGWDGTIRPPDANELGWKDTVRMNPLEDILVALQPITPTTPFPIRDSIRLMDTTTAQGTSGQFTGSDPFNNRITVTNAPLNFGWEYVWHCHILGHEENDMMRPILFEVPPPAPSALTLTAANSPATGINLTWTDNSASESSFTVARATDAGFTQNVQTFSGVPASPPAVGSTTPGTSYAGTITYNDTSAQIDTLYYYRVEAVDNFAPASPYPVPFQAVPLASAWSNTAQIGLFPNAAVSPTSLTFPNTVFNTSSAAQTVTISNLSPASAILAINSITITGANPGDFAQTNGCGTSVGIGSNCTINVTFKPTLGGARSATLTISTSDPNHPSLTVALNGTGLAPIATVSPLSVTFLASQLVNTTSSAQTVTLSNTSGTAALGVTSITITGDFSQSSTCGSSVAAGGSCSISLTFTPKATGLRSGTLTINTNDPQHPILTVSLSGTGIAPVASAAPGSLTFTSQLVSTTSSAQTVTLSNIGTASLILNSITTSGDFAQTNSCPIGGAGLPSPPPAAGTCTINVTFKPTAMGTRSGTLTINSSDPVQPTLTVSLTGNGIAPVANVSPSSIPFGNQKANTTSSPHPVTLSNTGTSPLIINSITLTGTNASYFAQTNNCPIGGAGLAVNASCIINVTFSPKKKGNFTASLSVSDTSFNGSPQTVTLTGTGQ